MASSSSSSISVAPQAKYDVFLSFRGEDTRHGFTSHLHKALIQKQVVTFFDDQLKRGAEISPALLKAIEESKISVIVFSKEYASSTWCLDELVKILQCRKMQGQMVLPVFYHVTPSDVRHQSGSFKDAFVEHERRLKNMPEKVQQWRDAMTQASNISGLDTSKIRLESNLVDEVVRDILEKLNFMSPSSDCQGLIGLKSRVEKIKSLLCIGLSDFRIVGIWGMGGIGKTTLAGAVYEQIYSQFDGHYFSINVREESEKFGLAHLREQLLSELLEEKLKIRTPNIPHYLRRRIQGKKVLIILDDVNTSELLDFLVGGLNQFRLGSRIIITTRDKQVLKSYGAHYIYEVEGFDDNEALQLFSNNAFKQNYPPKDFVELSNRVVEYAKGNPLALKVLASSLCGNSKQDWESAMSNLKMIGDPQIHDVLKISYERLNRQEKNIFLDIACFFKGEDKYHVEKILDGCYGFSTHVCLTSIMNKSLVSVSNKNELEMHDLLQEMGQEIVYQESDKKPYERSRLWYHEDVHRVLRDNKGTDSIEGLFLNMFKVRDHLQLSPEAFTKMSNLRLLKFYNREFYNKFEDFSKVCLPQGLMYLPSELRYLHWAGYPLKKLPRKFSVENLVELKMPCSKLKQLWKGTKHPSMLKFIDLHDSECLAGIPNLSNATGLEVINLQNCTSLVKIHSSIQFLDSIHILNLRGCSSFRSFPGNFHFRAPLTLDLSYCINLIEFPQISGNVRILYLAGTSIEEVSPSIEFLTELVELDMQNCTRLKILPNNICKLISLKRLNLSDCTNLKVLPENLGNLINLEGLDASGTFISQLPSSIARWKRIRELKLAGCNLDEIPEEICRLSSLEELDLSGNYFLDLPTTFKQLSRLQYLKLNNCILLQSFPELPLYLECLEAMNCKQLQSLPTFPTSLEEVDVSELKRSHYRSSLVYSFIFINSLEVKKNAYKKILADAQSTFQNKAMASLTCGHDKVNNQAPGFIFCLPGSEIPDWITYQSLGSVLTIDLSQYWFNKSFIGFILGVVVEFGEYDYNNLEIMCTCLLETKCGDELESIFFMSASESKVLFESDHLLLGYFPDFYAGIIEGEYKTISFDFTPYESYQVEVNCCGACPLYAQSNQAQTSIPNKNFAIQSQELGETMDQTDTDGSRSDTSDEEEAQVEQTNAPVINNNEVSSFYYILRALGFLDCWSYLGLLCGNNS